MQNIRVPSFWCQICMREFKPNDLWCESHDSVISVICFKCVTSSCKWWWTGGGTHNTVDWGQGMLSWRRIQYWDDCWKWSQFSWSDNPPAQLTHRRWAEHELISVMVLNDKEEQENHQWRILDEREWARDVFWHAYPMYNKMLISTTSRMNSCRGYSFAKASPCACICSSRPKPNSSQMHSSKPESKRKQQQNSLKFFLAACT